jgi:hypothetical protein
MLGALLLLCLAHAATALTIGVGPAVQSRVAAAFMMAKKAPKGKDVQVGAGCLLLRAPATFLGQRLAAAAAALHLVTTWLTAFALARLPAALPHPAGCDACHAPRPFLAQVVLTGDIKGLGSAGDLVAVKPAYAQNFLITKGLGKMATPDVLKRIEDEVRTASSHRRKKQ